MPAPICTIDSSCIIALYHLDLLPELTFLFSRVLLPKAVGQELFKRRSTKNRLRRLLRTYSFVECCDDYDKVAVDLLRIECAARGVEDRGEAEAVVQAAKVGAVVVIDDPWGRKLAARFGRDFHGTFWVLRRFSQMGLSSAADTRTYFAELLRQGTRLPWGAVNTFLTEIGESRLTGLRS